MKKNPLGEAKDSVAMRKRRQRQRNNAGLQKLQINEQTLQLVPNNTAQDE